MPQGKAEVCRIQIPEKILPLVAWVGRLISQQILVCCISSCNLVFLPSNDVLLPFCCRNSLGLSPPLLIRLIGLLDGLDVLIRLVLDNPGEQHVDEHGHMQVSPSLPNPSHRLMADMQKGRYVLQGMAVCNGELNKLSAKVPYQRGSRTCYQHGSLIGLMLLTKQPVQQKGQPLLGLDLAFDDGREADLGRPVLVLSALSVPSQRHLCIRGKIP